MNDQTPNTPATKTIDGSDLGIIRQAREKLNVVAAKVAEHNQFAAQVEARARELNEALSQARGAVLFVEEMVATKYDIDPNKEQINLDTGEVSPCSSK